MSRSLPVLLTTRRDISFWYEKYFSDPNIFIKYFQLSDLLLLCSPRKSMISGPQFSLRAKFEVDNLQVLEGDNLVTANTFYVRDDQKSVELYTITKTEKEEWLEFLFLAIKSLYTRKSSLRVGRDILRPLDSEIGKKAPHMQKLENVQKCAECSSQFSILKHKHNCRFCGAVSKRANWWLRSIIFPFDIPSQFTGR